MEHSGKKKAPVAQASLVVPGREGAILTLADGRNVLLDSLAKNGIVADQEGAVFIHAKWQTGI